ncbi:group II intron maturase-specific domain-containing protein [Xenorhabdus sp. XENO-2]|uniref:Group II intron maturase-specific domain-containing protein n=2 Tax=Xenorhabdus anantnagensis TaxID=3025875 RepID=A0ABT5LTZ3_9GAMM|nr:group II intron maturase-specific domain-containing protein [Xenorhabdus anantnagensis]
MNVARRGHVRQPYPVSNCQAGGDTEVKAKPFLIEKRAVYPRIAYCKDGDRKGRYEHISFDFLGYTFRPRLVKNRKRNSLFVSITPAVSKMAQKAMRFKIRKLKIRMRTELNLTQMANWLNPMISGWLSYYGQFCRSELYKVFRQLNKALVRGARRKYKALSRHKTQASKLLQRIAKQHPGLFAHWRAGMTGTFA